ncbi:2Fe-2S iron-sulfur cluster binding domain-containing protein [Rhodococcus sp. BP-252]|uniref:2Fe-2S iron-sulfur cluster-binding protein n=1 Tax=unclassified Rhodococcus (in: high G+C Gram-positive bacteria) TaxID=192944 RepID=UPI001C9A949E|nr:MULTISPECIES: 2Fe-2S iron-sulfur cluster-binding protein [unclassified Rhodococcus (in: high G+C Gram-positive bacteria)]MBY6414369.1 2Fe-2S iron-sulfur cluster binding domain-containing protein [Rhodococcus sp. BP-320]MBY6419506.1 2Fe-2S iron-sulfur cluster binding domain-containing protein [Rhodococcus sp. BP-321]MBY6424053.1 2Fe-2S iron-sulfur cluster binding domain-containing protein [Rhodococcus sp. BP-324]MBY6429264.1 2Fe-2S iron-sulfur cluster binding domain-containing protein [Rhodoc
MTAEHRVRLPGRDIECGGQQSILDATLRGGGWLSHSCTQGTCGTCKVKVLCGTVDHGASPEYTLTAEERERGLALACMASPCTDVVVEPLGVVADDGTPRYPLRDYEGTVTVLDDIASNTRRLKIRLDAAMEFNAGQYAEILVPGTGVGRQYSMANAPSESRELEFHIKRTDHGIATAGWIFGNLTVGDRVSLRGPLGQFGIVRRHDEPAILIGGGTGLAPLTSIVRHALEHDLLPELYLYHGGRRRDDLYDGDYFRDLERAHPQFHYRPALSEEIWDGACGLVTDVVLADFATCKGLRAYLCGPPPMVDAAVKALKRRRMAPRLVAREEFTASTPVLSSVL